MRDLTASEVAIRLSRRIRLLLTKSNNRDYGNTVSAVEGAGDGFASRGRFSTDSICRTFALSVAPAASSSALAVLASCTRKAGAL
jgi:hypothetical protein